MLNLFLDESINERLSNLMTLLVLFSENIHQGKFAFYPRCLIQKHQ